MEETVDPKKARQRKRAAVREAAREKDSNQEFIFTGNISNIDGMFSMFELGAIRKIKRVVKRSEFLSAYCQHMAGLYGLVTGERDLLKFMLSDRRFFSVFVYGEKQDHEWGKELGLTASSIHNYFNTLRSRKLLKKIRATRYRVNKDLLFSPGEVGAGDFLSVHLTYEFAKDEPEVVVVEKPKVTMEMINNLIEIYNRQEVQRRKVEEMFDPEKGTEKL